MAAAARLVSDGVVLANATSLTEDKEAMRKVPGKLAHSRLIASFTPLPTACFTALLDDSAARAMNVAAF